MGEWARAFLSAAMYLLLFHHPDAASQAAAEAVKKSAGELRIIEASALCL
jgi:hypothetical protein